ncbi:hypothetical protein M3936_14340 [Sutcliffiella horikoshii]|uniref:hypothetical protein n=1 Tax=Sutcliffiella horikoshii TaxID=79883 RepID=UPI00203E2347|nr:hypothetical protein [Sutcliffiella horikoshii]MCM3618766.1 hypothetical protein [Sutcliffiella horikoshii]
MIEGKGLGGKKINRVGVSLSNSYHKKLNRLAVSCNKKPTSLAGLILERCLDDALMVEQLQNEFGVYETYRVLPVKKHDAPDVTYMMKGETSTWS